MQLQKNSEMAICKGLLVLLAAATGITFASAYIAFYSNDAMGLIGFSFVCGFLLWLALGCLGLIRQGLPDSSDERTVL